MKKLNFPVIKGGHMPPPELSMDQYVDFVVFYLQNYPYRESDEERQRNPIRIPFKLK